MPLRIIPREAALADFDDIYERLAQRASEATAAEVLRKLDRTIQLLADQPHLGRPYEHRGHALRVLTHGDYRVFYREHPGEIDLLRVIDGRRNIPDQAGTLPLLALRFQDVRGIYSDPVLYLAADSDLRTLGRSAR